MQDWATYENDLIPAAVNLRIGGGPRTENDIDSSIIANDDDGVEEAATRNGQGGNTLKEGYWWGGAEEEQDSIVRISLCSIWTWYMTPDMRS